MKNCRKPIFFLALTAFFFGTHACAENSVEPRFGNDKADLIDTSNGLSPKDGVIYLASATVASSAAEDLTWHEFIKDEDFNRRKILENVVVIYSDGQFLDTDLIEKNVSILRKNIFSEYDLSEADFDIGQANSNLLNALHSFIPLCGFPLKDAQGLEEEVAFYGKHINGTEMCLFVGAMLGAYGYEIVMVDEEIMVRKFKE